MVVLKRAGKGKGAVVRARVKRGRKIGKGKEGKVHEVQIKIRKGRRKRAATLVEKKFFRKKFNKRSLGDPRKQFAVVSELIRLNRQKKLGLRLPATLRIKENLVGKPSLLSTKIKIVEEMTKAQEREFWKDIIRQVRIGVNNGFAILVDSFFPTIDPKSGKVVATIADFGNIVKGKLKPTSSFK